MRNRFTPGLKKFGTAFLSRPYLSFAPFLLLTLSVSLFSMGCAVGTTALIQLPQTASSRQLTITTTFTTDGFTGSAYRDVVATIGGVPPLTACGIVAGPFLQGSAVGTQAAFTLTARVGGGANDPGTNNTQCIVVGTVPNGVPPGDYVYTLRIVDSSTPSITVTQDISVRILAGFRIASFTLENATELRGFIGFFTPVGGTAGTSLVSCGIVSANPPAVGLSALVDSTNNRRCKLIWLPPSGAAGTYSLVVSATDPGLNPPASQIVAQSPAIQLIVNPPLRVPIPTLPAATQGSAYPASAGSFPTAGGQPPLTACTATGMPSGMTMGVDPNNRRNCLLGGAPAQGTVGTFSIVVTITDSATATTGSGTATSGPIPFTVALMSIPPITFGNGTQGRAFSQPVPTLGGNQPLTRCSATGLAPGLAITIDVSNTSRCLVSGTPTSSGTFSVVVTATDTAGVTGASTASSPTATLVINGPLQVLVVNLPNAVQGVAYSQLVPTQGGNQPLANCAQTGLPAGLTITISGTSCRISGTPTSGTGAAASVTVTATDTASTSTAAGSATSPPLSLTVNPVLSILAFSLGNGTQGRAFLQAVPTLGGNQPLSLCSQTGLPSGLSVAASGNSCVISGTPGAGTGGNTFNVTITATDSGSPTTSATSSVVSLVINVPLAFPAPPAIPTGAVGSTLTNPAFVASGGNGARTFGGFTATGACAGLSLNPTTGVLSGSPTTAGTCGPFTPTVTDTSSASTPAATLPAGGSITFTVNARLILSAFTIGNLTEGRAINPSVTVGYTGGIGSVTCGGGAPAGITISGTAPSPSNCTVGGAPSVGTAGTPLVTVTVIDSAVAPWSASSDNKNTTVTINAQFLITTTSPLATGVKVRAFSQTFVKTGGNGAVTWSATGANFTANSGNAGTACEGLTLAPATGIMTGPPAGAITGACTFNINVTDTASANALAATVTTAMSVTINLELTVTPSGALGVGVKARAFSVTFSATAGTGNGTAQTRAIAGANFAGNVGAPATPCEGLTFTPATGVLAGPPSGGTTGLCSFTITITDVANATTPGGTSPATATNTTINAALTLAAFPAFPLGPDGVVNRVWGPVTLAFAGGTGIATACSGAGLLPGTLAVTTVGANCSITGTGGAPAGSPGVAAAGGTLTVSVTDTGNPTTGTPGVAAGVVTQVLTPLNIFAALAVTNPGALGNGVVLRNFAFTFVKTGGLGAITWSVTGANFVANVGVAATACDGLSMNTGTGALTASPIPVTNTTGLCSFTITATDTGSSTTASGAGNLVTSDTINAEITVSPSGSLGVGVKGRTFTVTFSAAPGTGNGTAQTRAIVGVPAANFVVNSGGPGTACEGLTFTPATGVLSGPPSGGTTGLCSFTIAITDVANNTTPGGSSPATATDTTINAALTLANFTAPVIASPNGVVNRVWGPETLAFAGGTGIATTCGGSGVPANTLAVTTVVSDCSITGTGGAPAGSPGATMTGATLTVTVSDTGNPTTGTPAGNTTRTLTLDIKAVLAITSTSPLLAAVTSRTYNTAPTPAVPIGLANSGGLTPFTWSDVGLNAGNCTGINSIVPANGVVAGTPTTVGPVNCIFTATVTDTASATTASGSALLAFTLPINAPLIITTTQASILNGLKGAAYGPGGAGVTLAATGGIGAFTWRGPGGATVGACTSPFTGTLPPGLTVGSSTGLLSTTTTFTTASTTTTQFTFQICVTDVGNTVTPPGFANPGAPGTFTINVMDTFAYVAAPGTNTVEVINTTTNALVTSISTGAASTPEQVAVTPDGRQAWVTLMGIGKLAIIDAITNAQIVGSPLDISGTCASPRGIAIAKTSPAKAYVACNTADMDVIDTSTLIVTTLVGLGSAGTTLERVAAKPDGTRIYSTDTTNVAAVILDTSTDTEVVGSPVDLNPGGAGANCNGSLGLAVNPAGTKVYVACSNRRLGIITTATNVVTDTGNNSVGAAGASHDSVAFTPDGTRAYVTTPGNNQFSVVNVATDAEIASSPFNLPDTAAAAALSTPIGVTIPPLTTTFRAYIALSAGGSARRIAVIDNTTPPASNATATFNVTTSAAPRGIAHIPIPQ